MKTFTIVLTAGFLLYTAVVAVGDDIVLGTGPKVEVRTELDLFAEPLGVGWDFNLDGEGDVKSLSRAGSMAEKKIAVGMGDGLLRTLDAANKTWAGATSAHLTSGAGSGKALGAVARRADGHIVAGSDPFSPFSKAFYRDWTDVTQVAPAVTNGDFALNTVPVVAIDILPNDHFAVATEPTLFLRDKDDMHGAPTTTGPSSTGFAWGDWVQDIAVDPATGHIVIAHTYGGVETHHWDNLGTVVSSSIILAGNGTQPVTEVEILSDGTVVVGTQLGQIWTFVAPDNLTVQGGPFGFMAGGGTQPITALEVTSNDNIIIAGDLANGQGQVFVRDGHNPLSTPTGYIAGDGAVFEWVVKDILAIGGAAPTTCSEVLAMGYSLQRDLNDDCVVDFLDYADFLKSWGDCSNPTDGNCAPFPWE
jgi:hypothetical protein